MSEEQVDPKEIVVQLVENLINPLLARHNGGVVVEKVEGSTVHISLKGGCQGCAMAKQTLRNFVAKVIMTKLPCIMEVVDVTNHEEGENPYFSDSAEPEENLEEEA
jgi:Fe-S cluster biogenesis protein NfuA